jgi:hypothetical protein
MAMASTVYNGFATFQNVPKGEDVVVMYMNFNTENSEYLFVEGNTSTPAKPIEKGKIYLKDNWETELKALTRNIGSTGRW